jgi:hypothetical protein
MEEETIQVDILSNIKLLNNKRYTNGKEEESR